MRSGAIASGHLGWCWHIPSSGTSCIGGAAALAAERPIDRDDCAFAHYRRCCGTTGSGYPADGKPHYQLAGTPEVTSASRHNGR